MFFKAPNLIFLGREHPIVVQTALTDGDNFFIFRSYRLHPHKILLLCHVRIVRVNPHCSIDIMSTYKCIYLFIFFSIRPGQDADHATILCVVDNLFRIGKLSAK